MFNPAWPATGNSQVDDAAFALYALDLDSSLSPAELSLTWNGTNPSPDCWIGLPNWSGQSWDWGILPVWQSLFSGVVLGQCSG